MQGMENPAAAGRKARPIFDKLAPCRKSNMLYRLPETRYLPQNIAESSVQILSFHPQESLWRFEA